MRAVRTQMNQLIDLAYLNINLGGGEHTLPRPDGIKAKGRAGQTD